MKCCHFSAAGLILSASVVSAAVPAAETAPVSQQMDFLEIVAAGDHTSGDWRPTIMAGAMLGLLIMFLELGFFRRLLELSELSAPDWMIISSLVAIWAVTLQLIWRHRLMARAFGFSPTLPVS